jgi:RecA-family ATPase
LAALLQASGMKRPEAPVYVLPGCPPASEPDAASQIIQMVRQTLPGIEPALVVIDTMARSLGGLNENEASAAGVFLGLTETLARELRCHVMTVAHEGKDGSRGVRGSSAFEAGVDVIWNCDADRKTPTRLSRNQQA